ncbi:DUF4355 domain-containing protein [Clostridium sp. UBA3887]|uniref:DUF4355 domain-containing protein n=1 Tax=Clostridium sp. UBA3887 TaxID=1946356 RepID=UPI00321664F1
MLKKDLLEKIKSAKDDEDINSLLTGTDIEETFKASGLTLDVFKEKIKSDKDFKAYIESENDKYHNKALKTWKENNLEKELEPFITEKYPDLVTDPTQKKLLELEKELEKERQANAKKDLLAQAMKYATEKKLPANFVEKFLGEDLDSTKANLDGFEEDWSKGLESLVDEKMKQSSYVPGGSNPDGTKMSIGQSIAAENNSKSSAPSDPWASK